MSILALNNEILPVELRKSFFKKGQRLYKKCKTFIYNQGQTGEGIYYLHQGLVKIITISPNGSEKILCISRAGQLFGEHVIQQPYYFSSAITIEDSVIYYFPLQQLRQLLAQSPELNDLIIHSIIQKVRYLARNIALSGFSAEQRLAHTLLEIYRENKDETIFITQQNLANYLALTRITIYKTLRKWKKENIIDIRNQSIIIINHDLLSESIS